LRRADDECYAFTDHDEPLKFDATEFKADTGLSAKALEMSTGLSINNTEALGILNDDAISDTDIAAGRFDGAAVTIWLVNWRDTAIRTVLFEGTLGEVSRKGSVFEAEVRGISESLNRPWGRVFQRQCSALLGDEKCRCDLQQPEFSFEVEIGSVVAGLDISLAGLHDYDDKWFERGRMTVLSGDAQGLSGHIKSDRKIGAGRQLVLWQSMRANLAAGDRVRLEAGCDRTATTCKVKFDNFRNFRGFPHLPTDDWIAAYPVSSGRNDGGSLWRNSGSSEDV
jgi:uncharacterized phage protein (TIGR02218 family)